MRAGIIAAFARSPVYGDFDEPTTKTGAFRRLGTTVLLMAIVIAAPRWRSRSRRCIPFQRGGGPGAKTSYVRAESENGK
jgi:hypothetical protein